MEIPCQRSVAACLRRSGALQLAAVAAACTGGARFASIYTLGSSDAAVLWLPNAVVLTALLLSPARRWWTFGLVQLLAELLEGAGQDLLASAGLALAHLLEVLLCAALIRHWCGPGFAFATVRQVLLFAGAAMGLAPGLTALLGTWVHSRTIGMPVPFLQHWQTWWIADGTGLVVLTPLLFGWLRRPRRALPQRWTSRSERLLFLALLLTLMGLLFYARPDPQSPWVGSPLLLLPLFLWAALRLGTCGVSLLGCVVSLVAIVLTFQGRGMFSLLDAGIKTQLLQQYLAALLLTSLAVAAIVNELGMKYRSLLKAERRLETAHAALTVLNQELEARVAQRTAELERLATTDALTDAHNRRFLMARAEIEMAQAKRQQHSLSLVMFDIDHFKRINDSHGHNVGDRVLVALSDAVKKGLRLGDTFARVGGEEFVLLLPRSDAPQALQVALRLRAALQALEIHADPDLVLHITASFGVATLDDQLHTVDALYVAADTALYQAKAQGRNCVVAHRPQGSGLIRRAAGG